MKLVESEKSQIALLKVSAAFRTVWTAIMTPNGLDVEFETSLLEFLRSDLAMGLEASNGSIGSIELA